MIKTLFFTLALLTAQAQVDTGPSNLRTYTNIVDMLANASPLSSARAVQVLGYYTPGDGGGGMFTPAASQTITNRGLRFKSYLTSTAGFNRSLQAGEDYDVRIFGATSAAGNDDTLAMQDVFNVAGASNKVVLVPPGTYRVNRLNLLAPVRGYGDNSVIETTDALAITSNNIRVEKLKLYAFSYTAMFSTNAPLTNISVQDVTFVFDPTVTNIVHALLPNVIISSPMAFYAEFTEGLRIQNCRTYRSGIQVNRGNNLLFQGNYMDGEFYNMNELLHASSHTRATITDNFFLHSAADPLDLYSSGDGCRVVNNVFDGWGDPRLLNVLRDWPEARDFLNLRENTNALTSLGFNEAVITMKVVRREGVATGSGPEIGFTENTIISGNTMRDGRPTIDNTRAYGIMLKLEDQRVAGVAGWNLTNASRNILIQHNIIDGYWTNNPGGFNSIFFAGVHVDGSGIDISHNIVRNISLQGLGGPASSTAAVELGFNYGAGTNSAGEYLGTAAVGCRVAYNTYQGEGSGIIIYNATNCVIEGNIVQEDYAMTNFYTSPVSGLKPRYGMVIQGNMQQCLVRGNQFDPTFAGPAGVIQLGSTNYIDDCLFEGNFTTRRVPLAWVLPRARNSAFINNRMGPVNLGTVDGVHGIQFGNVLKGNYINGNGSLPGFDIAGQKNFQIVGNTFTNTLRAIQLRGGTNTTDTDIGLISDNFSMGENGSFIDTGTISATPLTRIIRYNNFANNALKPSGGNMNLGGTLNTGPIISSGFHQIPANSSYAWTSGSLMISSTDGFINLMNSTNGFGGLGFGGSTVNDFAIIRTATGLHFKTGNSSSYTDIFTRNLSLSGLAAGGVVQATAGSGLLTVTPALNLQMVIQDEGTSLTARGILDFVGTGVNAVDAGTKIQVHIDDPVLYYNNGVSTVPLPARDKIVFSGAGLTVVDNGVNASTDINVPGASGGEANTGDNLVKGSLLQGPYNSKLGTVLQFNTFEAGANMTITSNGPGKLTFAATVPGGDGVGYAFVEKNAVPFTQRSTLNFTGVGVTVSDASGKTVVDIPGATADGVGYAFIEKDLTPFSSRSTINFTGSGVTVSDVSGKTTVNIPAAAGGGDNITVGGLSATDPNFVDSTEIDFTLAGGVTLSATLINNSIVAARSTFTTTQRVLGKNSGGAGAGEEVNWTQLMEWVGSAARGDILYRGSGAFTRLPAGTAGQILQTGGTSGDPSWVTRTNYIVLALTDPSALVTVKTNYLSLPVGITLKAVAGRLFIAGSSGTTTIDLRKNGTSTSVLTTPIAMASSATVQAGTINGTQTLAANDSLVGVVTTVGPAAQGAQLMISYTIP